MAPSTSHTHSLVLAPRGAIDHWTPTPQCISHARFMHVLPLPPAIFLSLVFLGIAVIATEVLKGWTPGVKEKKVDEAVKAEEDVQGGEAGPAQIRNLENLVDGDEDVLPLLGEGDEAPPPYQAPEPAATSIITATTVSQTVGQTTHTENQMPKKPEIKYTSAHRFVVGTSLLLLIGTCLTLAGLSVQATVFCDESVDFMTDEPDGEFGVAGKVIFYILLSLPTSYASTVSLSCFLILLRNLWGPRYKAKYPLHTGSVALGVFMVVFCPFVAIGYLVGGGAVKGVQWCQRVCCGVEEEGWEGDGDLEMGTTSGGGVEGIVDGGGESVDDELGAGKLEGEKRVALMGGSGKAGA